MSSSVDASATIRAFGSALTAVCEGRIRVVSDGHACTDGQTIHLPYPSQIGNDLPAVLGVACHEAAHVYYDTPRHHRRFAQRCRRSWLVTIREASSRFIGGGNSR